MGLKYRVLWFEDAEDFIVSLKPRLEGFIDELGFEPKFEIEADGRNLDKLIGDSTFDLILLDFNLDVADGKGNGNELIEMIRKKEVYTETLFYSAQRGFRQHVTEHLDGVFFADRDELFEKAKKVIDLTIKKTQDINSLRGMVIAESIDMESKMDELLVSYFGTDDEKGAVFRKIVDPRFNALSLKKKCDLINKICKTRINCLGKKNSDIKEEDDGRLKAEIACLKQLKSEIGKIENEIIEVRNILAHTKEDPEKKNTLVSRINKKEEEITIDDNWCKEKRKDIRRQSENLDKLLSYMREND